MMIPQYEDVNLSQFDHLDPEDVEYILGRVDDEEDIREEIEIAKKVYNAASNTEDRYDEIDDPIAEIQHQYFGLPFTRLERVGLKSAEKIEFCKRLLNGVE